MSASEDITSGLRTLLLGKLNSLGLTRRFNADELHAVYSVAYAFVQQKNAAEALPLFAFLAQSQPSNRVYLTGLALCLQMSDRFLEAINVYTLVSVLHPEAHCIPIQIAECEIGMNEREAAKLTLGALLENDAALAPEVIAKAQALYKLLVGESIS